MCLAGVVELEGFPASRLSAVTFGSGSARDPSPPRRRRASRSSGRPDFRGTVVQKSQVPKPEGRTARSLRSSELPAVARVCCGDGILKSLDYVSFGFLFTSQEVSFQGGLIVCLDR